VGKALAFGGLEDAVRGEQPKHAAERVGMGADGARELLRRPRRVVEGVGDAEVGDDVQASRQAVAARDPQKGLHGVRVGFHHQLPLPSRSRISRAFEE
jgi:hypothetical protein